MKKLFDVLLFRLTLRGLLFFAPLVAFAQPFRPTTYNTAGQLIPRICEVAFWIFTFALIVSIIFVLIAAYKYLTASGDSAQVGEAHHMLIYAAIGLAVAVLAFSVPPIVVNIVSPGSASTLC